MDVREGEGGGNREGDTQPVWLDADPFFLTDQISTGERSPHCCWMAKGGRRKD